MGVFTYETETTSSIPLARLFKVLVLDADNLIPKIAPQAVKCTEVLAGNGGPGTVKKITFGEGSQYKYVKHEVSKIDAEKLTYSYNIVEGDALGDVIEKISYETKLVASVDGGSIVKSCSKYHTKGAYEIKEGQVKEGKDKASGLFKLVEGYLHANPEPTTKVAFSRNNIEGI